MQKWLLFLIIYNKFGFPFVFFLCFYFAQFIEIHQFIILIQFKLFIEFAFWILYNFFYLLLFSFCLSWFAFPQLLRNTHKHNYSLRCDCELLSRNQLSFRALHQLDAVDPILLWFYLPEHECPPLSNHTNGPSNRIVDCNFEKEIVRYFVIFNF